MEWLAVASAVVPGTSATTLALITSHTLTTVRSSGAWCSRRSVPALSLVFSSVMWPPYESSPEDPVHHRARQARVAQLVVDHRVRRPRRVAEDRGHRGPLPHVAGQLVAGSPTHEGDRVADVTHPTPALLEHGGV